MWTVEKDVKELEKHSDNTLKVKRVLFDENTKHNNSGACIANKYPILKMQKITNI